MLTNIISKLEKDYVYENPWVNTPYYWISIQPSTVKGKIGEDIVSTYLNLIGYTSTKNQTPAWDLNVDDMRVEVKLSLLNKTGLFKFLQIRPNDDYTHMALLAITYNSSDIYLIPKDELKDLKPQHSGERGSKDTYYLGITPQELKIRYSLHNLNLCRQQ